jgi:hypothetical protein
MRRSLIGPGIAEIMMTPKILEFPAPRSARRKTNAIPPENRSGTTRNDRSEPPAESRKNEQKDTTFPNLLRQGRNLAESITGFLADRGQIVDEATMRRRLECCDRCPRLRGRRCLLCGCYLPIKAWGRAFRCPEDRWEA